MDERLLSLPYSHSSASRSLHKATEFSSEEEILARLEAALPFLHCDLGLIPWAPVSPNLGCLESAGAVGTLLEECFWVRTLRTPPRPLRGSFAFFE